MELIMFLHVVLLLTLLTRAGESKVVDKHFTPCQNFFYKQTPPRGFDGFDNLKQICQRYNNRYHFASSHSSNYRIPIYSAYTLDTFSCQGDQPARRSTWFVEPQIAVSGTKNDMMKEGDLNATIKHAVQAVQALNIDYANTNYDKGHLNPNFYQCDEGRTATFTLTNAVPQDPCFNQQEWKTMEKRAKDVMEHRCNFPGAKRYFVTGAVPSTQKIPSLLHDKEGDRVRQYQRVSVPSGMWTAACCDSSMASTTYQHNGFSFGYYGDNLADTRTTPYTVSQLETVLKRKYSINTLSIFADSCTPDQTTTNTVIFEDFAIAKWRNDILDVIKDARSNEPSIKRRHLENIVKSLHENTDLANNVWMLDGIKIGMLENRDSINQTRALLAKYNLTTLLVCPNYPKCLENNTLPNLGPRGHDELRRRRDSAELAITGQTDPVVDAYIVVPSSESTISAAGDRCRHDHPCGLHNKTYNWCYTDWSGSWDYCCIDECGFSESTNYPWCHYDKNDNWAYCSPRGSIVTIEGSRCRADHECATHGKSYYWCYTDANQNWKYCCQPWHECSSKHDAGTDKWCYAGYKNETTKETCKY